MLELAGIKPEELARSTRLVLNKFTELLEAQCVTRLVVSQGRDEPAIVQEFTDQDGALQARAAAELVDILGLKPSRSQGLNTGGGPVSIKVTFVERPAQPKHDIDVTPRKA